MRAFSIVETLIIAAVLAALVAIAAPSLAPVLYQSQLRRSAEAVADAVYSARQVALESGRCVRVRPEGERRVVIEKLNTYDCLGDPARAPRASEGPLWQLEPGRVVSLPASVRVRLDRERTPTATRRGAPPPGTGQRELRFLPDGTLLTNGEGPYGLELSHRRLDAEHRAHVVVEKPGVTCVVFGRRVSSVPSDEHGGAAGGCP